MERLDQNCLSSRLSSYDTWRRFLHRVRDTPLPQFLSGPLERKLGAASTSYRQLDHVHYISDWAACSLYGYTIHSREDRTVQQLLPSLEQRLRRSSVYLHVSY